jgi:hypothetical protein
MTTIIDGTAGITFPNSTVQASAGQVLQVVQGTYATQTTTTSGTYSATGLTATITPKFANSKILVLASYCFFVVGSNPANASAALYRNNATQLTVSSYTENGSGISSYIINQSTTNYIDLPATTSATTYTIYYKASNSGTAYINAGGATATITLLEIAG